MSTINITTGYGYFKDDQDRICGKAVYPIGQHEMDDSLNLTYTEVDDQDALDAIVIDTETQKGPDWTP